MSTLTLMTRLREATREAHEQIQKLPWFHALERCELPVESYVGQLRGMAVLHGILEHEAPTAHDARLNAVWREDMRRFPQIQQDLAFFATRNVFDIPMAHEAASALADHILQRSADSPVSLLGYFYVLEGSIQGAMVLAPLIGKTLGLDEHHGLSYLSWEEHVARERWRNFGARMNAVSIANEEEEAIITAAREAFAEIYRLFQSLYPFDPGQLTRKVTALNPEAGAHPVPDDPGEIEAALHAGQRCWLEYPYFAWRFGERGRRYTNSDGAWLVTLAARDQAVINAQVEWLGVVLASRGIPRILLQRHLELLYEELMTRMPAQRGVDYRKLLIAADHLAEQRRAVISDADFDAICNRFAQAVGPDWRARLPGIGNLLVSAVTDQRHGITQAVTRLESWLTDPERFPPHWIAAVREGLRQAQERVSVS
ncbi:MAG: biliverdin-producing heme oxygenase [Candidatus Competibacteraceae bacterium]|nr:biliverdin-producing heme oxygenase [Candidatus Competibacteraceae bacterium]